MVISAIATLGEGAGAAEPCYGSPPWTGVVSGRDARRGDDAYILQLFAGTSGGPATAPSDGWLTYNNTGASGVGYIDSVEILEQKYPMVIWESRVRVDSDGAGRTRGAPGNVSIYGPRFGELTSHYFLDSVVNRGVGVRGGGLGLGPRAALVDAAGAEHAQEQTVGETVVPAGSVIVSWSGGGGGYGRPLERAPAEVLRDVVEGYVSVERARDAYGVALRGDVARWETLAVDRPATARLRARLDAEGADDDGARWEVPVVAWWRAPLAVGCVE
jgi:N-methylhydantoinase B